MSSKLRSMDHVVILSNLSYKAQIALLEVNKALITILSEYTDFADIFSLVLVSELLNNTWINNYVIELMNYKLSYYRLIYILKLVELET